MVVMMAFAAVVILIVVSSTAGVVVFMRSYNQRNTCKYETRGVFPVSKGLII